MKYLYMVIVVIIIVAGGYYLFNTQENTSSDTPGSASEGSASMEVPALGNENSVAEMIVTEDASAPKIKEFNVSGKNFSFSVGEIRVKQGDTVRINFTSAEGTHDWVVDKFDAKTKRVNTNESVSVEFIADQTGIFEYYCSVGSHRALGMVGNLVVE